MVNEPEPDLSVPEAEMPIEDPMISNISDVRFLYGSYGLVNEEPVFYGAVVFGSDFTYDAETGQPLSGLVERIELQTRSETGVQSVHGVYDDFGASVAELNAAFCDAQAPWYDAQLFFSTVFSSAVPDAGDTDDGDVGAQCSAASQTSKDTSKTYTHEYDAQTGELTLLTGDVLTKDDLSKIFSAGADQDRGPLFDAPQGQTLTAAPTDLKDITENTFIRFGETKGETPDDDNPVLDFFDLDDFFLM